MEKLLKPKEVAGILSISEQTLNKLREEGEIEGIPISGKERIYWRYAPSTIKAYIERGHTPKEAVA